jgi:ArsR family metal-binding transcriptional regulator
MRQRLKPMEVYKLLPATNCKECGQPTCFTFALKITAGEVELEQCALLFIDGYGEKREKLIALLEGAVN